MEYPNPAFSRMTERDAAWMARILARFTPEMVRALAEMGRFSDRGDTRFIAETLEQRLEKILDRYLTRLSPLGGVHVEQKTTLCAVDAARLRNVRPASSFHYDARTRGGDPLGVTARDDGSVCVALPASRVPDGGAPVYGVLSITNGVAPGALEVHLYDLGPAQGYFVAGVERRSAEAK
jgi:hypothetical protein